MDKKLKVTFVLNRIDVTLAMRALKEKLSDERWEKMTESELIIDSDSLSNETYATDFILGVAFLAISKIFEDEQETDG